MDADDDLGHPRPEISPPAWILSALAIGLVLLSVIGAVGVVREVLSTDLDAYGECETAKQAEQALIRRTITDVLPTGSLREVSLTSEFDWDCEFGDTTLTARWDRTTGAAMVEPLEAHGWRKSGAREDLPDWYTQRAEPTGAAGKAVANDSPSLTLTRTVDNRDLELALNRDGLAISLERRTTLGP